MKNGIKACARLRLISQLNVIPSAKTGNPFGVTPSLRSGQALRRTRRFFAALAAHRTTRDGTAQNDTEWVICACTRDELSTLSKGKTLVASRNHKHGEPFIVAGVDR